MIASGSSVVPGIWMARGSASASFTSTASAWSTAQPMRPSPNGTMWRDLLGEALSGEHRMSRSCSWSTR